MVRFLSGKVIDLHNTVTKRLETSATAINDLGEILIEGFILHEDGKLVNLGIGHDVKTTDTKYFYTSSNAWDAVYDKSDSDMGPTKSLNLIT